jgi:hypothetical protein
VFDLANHELNKIDYLVIDDGRRVAHIIDHGGYLMASRQSLSNEAWGRLKATLMQDVDQAAYRVATECVNMDGNTRYYPR